MRRPQELLAPSTSSVADVAAALRMASSRTSPPSGVTRRAALNERRKKACWRLTREVLARSDAHLHVPILFSPRSLKRRTDFLCLRVPKKKVRESCQSLWNDTRAGPYPKLHSSITQWSAKFSSHMERRSQEQYIERKQQVKILSCP